MPEYWEDDKGARTQLQVGTVWPASGGPAFAGSPHGWPCQPNYSSAWLPATFSETGGLQTVNMNSCSALVYLFGPAGGSATHGALWHVNGSGYVSGQAPAAALNAIGVNGLELKYVVIGYNQITQGEKMAAEVQNCIAAFKAFLQKEKVTLEPWIYVGNSDWFGVSKDGFVGRPAKLAVDTISPRRQSLSETKGSGTNLQQTTTCCSKCYITTAVCRSLGLGDDCAELRTLRLYRDTVLSQTDSGRAEVRQYYATAPSIVARIEAQPDAGAVYASLHAQDIVPALGAIARGDHDQARSIYRAMYERLRARYL